MGMKRKRDADEEAVLKRLMAEYAEEEGARLWREFEEAQARGEVPEMSEELDRKCLRLIEQEFAPRRARTAGRPLLKFAERAAAAVMVGACFDGGAASKEDPEELRALLDEKWPEE